MQIRSVRFFRATVEPTVNEFFVAPDDTRRGRLAAIVLYHMADYYLLDHKCFSDLAALRKELIKDCPDFKVIRDVADASKHDQLTTSNRILTGSDQIRRRPGVFEAPLNTAVFNEASVLEYVLDDGISRPLVGATRSVFEMWKARL